MKAFLKDVRLAVRRAVSNLAKPYAVSVSWGGDSFTHRAANLDEANNWASLYPATADVWVTTRTGRVVSYRSRARVFGWDAA